MKRPKEMIVALSLGKDSLATIDICSRQFDKLHCFFMYWVRGLSFQTRILDYVKERYKVEVYEVPINHLSELTSLQLLSWYRPSMKEMRQLSIREVFDHVRRHFGGLEWIATGEKQTDDPQRMYMLKHEGMWNKLTMTYSPVFDWSHNQVFEYLRLRHIPIPPGYTSQLTYRFEGFKGETLFRIALAHPEDYQKILAVFPFAEGIRKRFELYDSRAAVIRSSLNAPVGTSGSTVEPKAD